MKKLLIFTFEKKQFDIITYINHKIFFYEKKNNFFSAKVANFSLFFHSYFFIDWKW